MLQILYIEVYKKTGGMIRRRKNKVEKAESGIWGCCNLIRILTLHTQILFFQSVCLVIRNEGTVCVPGSNLSYLKHSIDLFVHALDCTSREKVLGFLLHLFLQFY